MEYQVNSLWHKSIYTLYLSQTIFLRFILKLNFLNEDLDFFRFLKNPGVKDLI